MKRAASRALLVVFVLGGLPAALVAVGAGLTDVAAGGATTGAAASVAPLVAVAGCLVGLCGVVRARAALH